MLKLYYSGAPNPAKVALFLEEAGMPYEAIPVDTRKGEQHSPEYLKINPNAKVPAIVDGDVVVFDSSACLLYLADKTGKFLPAKIPYAMNRYAFEAQRHFKILEDRLSKQPYMLGNTYTIVDMNVWGWARMVPTVLGEGAWDKFPNLKRYIDGINARPAAKIAGALKDRHKFKAEMDAEANKALFGHLSQTVA